MMTIGTRRIGCGIRSGRCWRLAPRCAASPRCCSTTCRPGGPGSIPGHLEQRPWLAGSTLCYRRTFWASHRFANLNVGEDAQFVWSGRAARIVVLPDVTFHVGLIHGRNVSPKRTEGPYWQPYAVEAIQRLLGDDWPCYRQSNRATQQCARTEYGSRRTRKEHRYDHRGQGG